MSFACATFYKMPPPAGGAAWREFGYSENGDWKTGRTSIGYGDNDDQNGTFCFD